MSRLSVPVLLTTAVAVLAACGGSSSDDQPTRSARSGEQATKRYPEDAIVFIQARYKKARGVKPHTTSVTGFVYDAREGLVLTADSGVDTADAITVTSRRGRVMNAEVGPRAQCHDFAVLRLSSRPASLKELTFGDSSAVRRGDEVAVPAYAAPPSEDGEPAFSTFYGTVGDTGVRAKVHSELPPMEPLFVHRVPLGDAASGGPLINARGQVIGLNTLTDDSDAMNSRGGRRYALASNRVYALLRGLSKDPDGKLGGWRAEHNCHRAMDRIVGVPYQHTMGPGESMAGGRRSMQSGKDDGAMSKKDDSAMSKKDDAKSEKGGAMSGQGG